MTGLARGSVMCRLMFASTGAPHLFPWPPRLSPATDHAGTSFPFVPTTCAVFIFQSSSHLSSILLLIPFLSLLQRESQQA